MTQSVQIKKHYDAHPRVTFTTDKKSLTHQSMADECDINRIMAKFQKTGILDHRNSFEGQYGDFTNAPEDYHSSMNAVLSAETMFKSLPSSVRKKFQNDPGQFIDFVGDPANKKEMISMGLAYPEKPGATDALIDAGDTPAKAKPKAPTAAVTEPKSDTKTD